MAVALFCGVAPEVACFMPGQTLTQPEMDCCINNPGDCGQMDMSCCRPVVRAQLGVAVKPIQNPIPNVDIAPKPLTAALLFPNSVFPDFGRGSDHAPPPQPEGSCPVLRI
jgi:hypothetical protein